MTHHTRTTITAFHVNGGVVLASDSQVTMGSSFIWDLDFVKVYNPFPNCYIAFSGSVVAAHQLLQFFSDYVRRIGSVGYSPKANFFRNVVLAILKSMDPSSQGLVHGLCVFRESGRCKIYEFFSGGAFLEVSKYAACGSGMLNIYPFMDALWKEGMSFEEGKKLAADAISVSVLRDCFSGGRTQISVLGERDQTLEEWSSIPHSQRGIFLKSEEKFFQEKRE